MNKQEFSETLRRALSGLPPTDVEERLAFYGEAIDDRMEEGMTEEEAVAAVGSIDDIVSQTLTEVPLARLVKERIKPVTSAGTGKKILLALGFPLWFPLLLAAGAILLSLYVVIWAVDLSLWAVDVSLGVCAPGGIVAAVVYAFRGSALSAISLLGLGLCCAGIAIFFFFGCVAASGGAVVLTKKTALGVKSLFVGKERVR